MYVRGTLRLDNFWCKSESNEKYKDKQIEKYKDLPQIAILNNLELKKSKRGGWRNWLIERGFKRQKTNIKGFYGNTISLYYRPGIPKTKPKVTSIGTWGVHFSKDMKYSLQEKSILGGTTLPSYLSCCCLRESNPFISKNKDLFYIRFTSKNTNTIWKLDNRIEIMLVPPDNNKVEEAMAIDSRLRGSRWELIGDDNYPLWLRVPKERLC